MIFVDTGAWIAIYKRNDRHHRESISFTPIFFLRVVLKGY